MAHLVIFGRRRADGVGRLIGGIGGGLAAGAGLMYFLDPLRGAARRAQVRDRAASAVRSAEDLVETGARDLEHRARGLAHEAKARLEAEPPSDEVLAERVRAALGRLTSHPGAIVVSARGGEVELSGRVLATEAPRVVAGARRVRGVRGLVDHLQHHASAEGIPALQGGGPAAGPRPELPQRSWSPALRLLAGAGGLFLVARAVLGGGWMRLLHGLAGWTLLARAAGSGRRPGGAHGPPMEERGRARRRAARAPRPERRPGQEDRGAGLAPEAIVAPSEITASPIAPGEPPIADEPWPRNRERTPDLTERIRPEDEDLG
jgi:hypothetical protein